MRIVKKEFIQVRRDPNLLRMIILVPVFQLMVFGYAVSTDVRNISTAVYDEDRTASSRRLQQAFTGSGYFDLDYHIHAPREADRLLDAGQAQMVLHIPRGFDELISRGQSAPLQVIFDGSDSQTSGTVAGYTRYIVQRYSSLITLDRLSRAGGGTVKLPGIEERVRVWYNPELKSVNYMVPAVLCMILLIVTMIMTSMAIVREREIGTLEQLVVTPITPGELMLGKTIPFICIGLLDMMLVLLISVYWFKVEVVGSIPLLIVMSLFFLLTSLGLGLFISTISRTQQEAMMVSFFIMLPSMMLSGFMFPIRNMPRIIQWITYAIPLRYFLVIVRGIFLKGNGLDILWPQAAALAAFGIAIIFMSATRFSKRMG